MTIYIAILLTVWIIAFAVKTYWPASEKRYIKARIAGTKSMLWDAKLLFYKKMELREDIRKEHDRCVEAIDALDTQAKNPKHKKETVQELEAQKEAKEKDLGQFVSQLKEIDIELANTQTQIDSLKELQAMAKDYLKTL